MTCRDRCEQYRAKRPRRGGRYASGQKRCQICSLYIYWDGFKCPCCGYMLRRKPRSPKNRTKYHEEPRH